MSWYACVCLTGRHARAASRTPKGILTPRDAHEPRTRTFSKPKCHQLAFDLVALKFAVRVFLSPRARATPRHMALLVLSEDEQRVLFGQLCNTLEPHGAVALASVSRGLRATTQALLQQLRADHEAAAALYRKMKHLEQQHLEQMLQDPDARCCKKLRETKQLDCVHPSLSSTDLATLGSLGSELPALEHLSLSDSPTGETAGPDGMQRLFERLDAGALPAVTNIFCTGVYVGDAGASALAAALGRGALPRLAHLDLNYAGIGDAGLVALAPALRRLHGLERFVLMANPFGNEGLAALVAPPMTAGAPPPPTGGLAKLKTLLLPYTQIADAGCATLAAALASGALPALQELRLCDIPASAAAKDAVWEALLTNASRAPKRGTRHWPSQANASS